MTSKELARLMAPLGPFEAAPSIAVAVSGGMDSMALAVLLKDWSGARGGHLTALVVDHGLRPESPSESRQVAAWLEALDIDVCRLTWRGPKPESGRQAAARAARYALMSDWCARHGTLHLATAHHQDDQAETFLLRLGRGSGLDGLAAMPAIRELDRLRLLRPILGVPKARLEATLRARNLPWVDDPSNRNPAFARTALRSQRPALDAQGLDAPCLAAAADQLGRARSALERGVAALLAKTAEIDPAGFAWAEPEPLIAAGAEIGMRALARLLLAIGGDQYTPRSERLQRLYGRLGSREFRGGTLAGCRVLPRAHRLLIVREAARVQPVRLEPGRGLRWDGRFDVALPRRAGASGPLVLGALGQDGWAAISSRVCKAQAALVPPAARPSLPALRDRRGLLAVPHLSFARGEKAAEALKSCLFAPQNPLAAMRFTVA